MNIIVIMGPPGAGKGTQAKELAKKHGYIHISTGDLLRERIAEGGDDAEFIKDCMAQNDLHILNDVVIGLIKARIATEPAGQTIMFDGFPRTLEQAELLTKMVAEENWTFQLVLGLEISDQTAMARIQARARNELDLDPVKVQKRIDDHHALTQPLIDYYKGRGLYRKIESGGSIGDVTETAEKVIREDLQDKLMVNMVRLHQLGSPAGMEVKALKNAFNAVSGARSDAAERTVRRLVEKGKLAFDGNFNVVLYKKNDTTPQP